MKRFKQVKDIKANVEAQPEERALIGLYSDFYDLHTEESKLVLHGQRYEKLCVADRYRNQLQAELETMKAFYGMDVDSLELLYDCSNYWFTSHDEQAEMDLAETMVPDEQETFYKVPWLVFEGQQLDFKQAWTVFCSICVSAYCLLLQLEKSRAVDKWDRMEVIRHCVFGAATALVQTYGMEIFKATGETYYQEDFIMSATEDSVNAYASTVVIHDFLLPYPHRYHTMPNIW